MHLRVAEALRRLKRERRTGVFRTAKEGVQREVVFENGAIVAAQSSSGNERLGELMVQSGLISERDLLEASKYVKPGHRLGDVLVELGILDREQVETVVRAQLAAVASKLLTEPLKKLEFRSAPAPKKRFTDRPVPVDDAILEAARRSSGRDRELGSSIDAELVPSWTEHTHELLHTLNLKSHEAFILSRCDGQSTVHDILAQIPLPEEQTASVLLGLEQAGVITMSRSRPPGH